MKYLSLNGEIELQTDRHLSAENRSFRFGDGCFETMKMQQHRIVLFDLHMNRLFSSLDKMQFEVLGSFSPQYISESILALTEANHVKDCRIRLTIFRGNGGLNDPDTMMPKFIIQQYPLQSVFERMNKKGVAADFYLDAIKGADQFSSIKSNSFLPYAMAALWAKKQKLDDAILLNQYGRLADSTIANVFIITNGIIKTPALTEGCVAGVMRQHLLTHFKKNNFIVQEGSIEMEEALNASEIFFTNAIRAIQWVRQLGKSNYTNDLTQKIYNEFILPLQFS